MAFSKMYCIRLPQRSQRHLKYIKKYFLVTGAQNEINIHNIDLNQSDCLTMIYLPNFPCFQCVLEVIRR